MTMLGTILSKEEVDDFMLEADVVRQNLKRCITSILVQDGNGQLDYEEFVNMMQQY